MFEIIQYNPWYSYIQRGNAERSPSIFLILSKNNEIYQLFMKSGTIVSSKYQLCIDILAYPCLNLVPPYQFACLIMTTKTAITHFPFHPSSSHISTFYADNNIMRSSAWGIHFVYIWVLEIYYIISFYFNKIDLNLKK